MMSLRRILAPLVLGATWCAALVAVPTAARTPATARRRGVALRGGSFLQAAEPLFGTLFQTVEPLLQGLNALYKAQPYQSAFVTCAVKALAADSVAQLQIEKSPRLNLKRSAAFVAYGGFYQGVAQYEIFNKIYPALFGHGHDVATVAREVLFDQLITTPFLCLPIAYLVKAVVFKYSPREGIRRYIADARRDLLVKYWCIWTPVTAVTFSVVPDHLRIPFIAFVSFFWLIILSSISSRASDDLCTSIASQSSADGCNIPEYENFDNTNSTLVV